MCASLSRSVPRFFKCVPHELLIIAGQLRRPEVECQLVDLPCELERQLVAVIHPRAGIDADIEGLVDCHEECNRVRDRFGGILFAIHRQAMWMPEQVGSGSLADYPPKIFEVD
jgi:hypothetical protein